jgi:uncharacterized cupin superfamily protein
MSKTFDPLHSPALDSASVAPRIGSAYPASLAAPFAKREKRALGDAGGLSQFGVNVVRLPPGAASAHRHWHSKADEFVYVLAGEVVLITEAGEQTLGPGMAACFPAGRADGHCLVNRSSADATYLEVGSRSPEDVVEYPDADLKALPGVGGRRRFVRKNGQSYA